MSPGLRRWGGMAAIAAAVAAAPSLCPLRPDLQEDPAGARYLPPLTRGHALRVDAHRTWILTGLSPTPQGWSGRRAGSLVTLSDSGLLEAPQPRFYLLGTDSLGRDLLSRLLHAARHTLGVTLAVVALALLAGILVGMAAGWMGGWRDAVLMRGVDALLCLPRLVFYLACAAVLPPSTSMLILVLSATTWTGLARLVRAEVLALRDAEMAMAARAAGCSPARIATRHLLPAIAPTLGVMACLRIADTILLESAVSFLGLGAPAPAVSLGEILAAAREGLPDSAWAAVWPGLAIVVMVAGARAAASGSARAREGPSVA